MAPSSESLAVKQSEERAILPAALAALLSFEWVNLSPCCCCCSRRHHPLVTSPFWLLGFQSQPSNWNCKQRRLDSGPEQLTRCLASPGRRQPLLTAHSLSVSLSNILTYIFWKIYPFYWSLSTEDSSLTPTAAGHAEMSRSCEEFISENNDSRGCSRGEFQTGDGSWGQKTHSEFSEKQQTMIFTSSQSIPQSSRCKCSYCSGLYSVVRHFESLAELHTSRQRRRGWSGTRPVLTEREKTVKARQGSLDDVLKTKPVSNNHSEAWNRRTFTKLVATSQEYSQWFLVQIPCPKY